MLRRRYDCCDPDDMADLIEYRLRKAFYVRNICMQNSYVNISVHLTNMAYGVGIAMAIQAPRTGSSGFLTGIHSPIGSDSLNLATSNTTPSL